MNITNDYINSGFIKSDSTSADIIALTYLSNHLTNTADDSGISYSSTNKVDEKVDELESKLKYLEDTITILENRIRSLEFQLKDCKQEKEKKEIENETLEII